LKTYNLPYLFLCLTVILALAAPAHAQLTINTIAGDGTFAFGGDGAPATDAQLNTPYGVAVDNTGNVYFTDAVNNRIRKIDPSGIITTIAGTGASSYTGDGGQATAATLYNPRGIVIDGSGNIYFSDYGNNRIRKINAAGIITTFAGTGFAAADGDGGPAVAAALNYPWGLALDAAGNLYIADQINCRIRKVNTSGIISTICGTGIAFYNSDGIPATDAWLQYPYGVAVDPAGNIYIADEGNNRIRKINTSGIISTVAGSAVYGFTGDGGPSTLAKLFLPMAVAADNAGNVYISDANNRRIRMIDASGNISTIVGNGTAGYSGDGGAPTLAEINQPTGIAIDADGKVYIADNNNSRVRILHVVPHPPTFTGGHEQYLTFCATEAESIDTLLSVADADMGQTETWTVVSPPLHGGVTAAYTTTSTGGTMVPTGLNYLMGILPTGFDTFKIAVNDGTLTDTTTIYVTIQNFPFAGNITTGIDSICPGDTLTFTDTTTGGTWSVSNTALSSISPSGLLTGVSAGMVNVVYSVTNLCGTATATYPLRVRSSGCPTQVSSIASRGAPVITPNPNDGNFSINLGLNNNEQVHLIVSDVLGKMVKEIYTHANGSINIHLDAPEGIYFLSAVTEHGTTVNKVVLRK